MRTFADLLKSLLIGGLVFLIPFGVIVFVLDKLIGLGKRVADALQKWVMPGVHSDALSLAIAIFGLLLLALAAGMIARTLPGKAIFGWFERTLFSNLPLYTVFRQIIPDTHGSEGEVPAGHNIPVVTVQLDDQILIGLLIDSLPNGDKVVYVPDAPTGFSGSVTIVEPGRLKETKLSPRQLLQGLRQLGGGMAELQQKLK